MGFQVYHISSERAVKWYATKKGATIGMKSMNRNAGQDAYAMLEDSEFEELMNPWTTTTSLMTGATVSIRKQDLGTCVDPGTERYWSM